MAKPKPKPPLDAVTALCHIRDDIKALDWRKIDDDGIQVLVSKAEVLDIVQDWIEYCLNPAQTTLATADD